VTHYEVHLKDQDVPMPLDADKFYCEPGYVTFYARPAPGEKFEEVARFGADNVTAVRITDKEPKCLYITSRPATTATS